MLSIGAIGVAFEGPDNVPVRTREQALLAILDGKITKNRLPEF